MTARRRTSRRRPVRGADPRVVGATAVALLFGTMLVRDGLSGAQPPLPAGAAADPSHDGASAPDSPTLDPSAPRRLRIPSISVDATFTDLGLDAKGALETPPAERANLVGWYRDGAAPGEDGTAVVVGHVDDKHGPGVLYRLGLLRPGLAVAVTRADRKVVTFTIDQVRSYPKTAFPSDEVYAATGRAELRIITCGGHYDHKNGYDSNTVVFAHLTSSSPAPA
ncbi:class F sortase [Kitasatospora sp. NPDC004622]|uniref:class F sortase n=1 Tax=Kitasatospora sp. NPDC004622 TaxID=3364018 RepID=UPI0036A816C1